MTRNGLYISTEILGIKGSTMTEKAILSLVTNFNNKGCFRSNRSLASFLGCGVTSVKDSIRNLKSKGYIKRSIEEVEPKKFKRVLRATRPESDPTEEELPGRNPTHPRPESDPPQAGKRPTTRPESDHPSKRKGEKKLKTNLKKTSEHDSEEFRLAKFLFENIRSRKPDFKKPNLPRWAKEIDRMVRLDNRKPERIKEVLQWVQTDSFWQNKILSCENLRRHFDRLEMQMSEKRDGRSTKHSRDFSQQESSIGTFIR